MSGGEVRRGTGAANPPTLLPTQQASTGRNKSRLVAKTQAPPAPRIYAVPLSGAIRPRAYRTVSKLGIEWRMKRSKKDQKILDALYDDAMLEMLERESDAEIMNLTDEVSDLVVAFVGIKGGAATTTTLVESASYLSEIARPVLTVFDGNPASGNSAERLGKDYGDTVTVQELVAQKDNIKNSRDYLKLARPTRYSVRVVSSADVIGREDHLEASDYEAALPISRENSEYVFVDTANDAIDDASLALIKEADVMVFTANVSVRSSLQKLGTTMQSLRLQPGLEERVNKSVVVVSNLPSGAELSSYRKYLNKTSIDGNVVAEYPFEGMFVSVPHDDEIALDREVNLEKNSRETAQAYREIIKLILEQGKLLKKEATSSSKGTVPELESTETDQRRLQ